MKQLPPGQRKISSFPRFGLPQYAPRVVPADSELQVTISGAVGQEGLLAAETLADLPHIDQVSDFHCVTTWSAVDLAWGGYRFSDVYEQILKPQCRPDPRSQYIRFRCLDGYKTDLLLSDLLSEDVLLADTLNGESLGTAHGAPIRLVMPKHYGYKNPKHLKRLEFHIEKPVLRSALSRLIDHPRARVEFEERAPHAPGWILRGLNRLLINTTIRRFEKALGGKPTL